MPLNGAPRRYFYNGERVLEELSDSGTMQARYTTENDSYYGQWLHLYRPTGSLSRFPMYDNIGSTRGLLDASGTATDWYELDTFGRQMFASGPTPNPYRFGGAWGYITDTPGSGLLQLGARLYWPEVGRFVQQGPAGEGANRYAYADGNPLTGRDPEGLAEIGFDAYLGVGMGFTAGYQRGRGFFLKARAGFGVRLGGVLSIDPCAPSPGSIYGVPTAGTQVGLVASGGFKIYHVGKDARYSIGTAYDNRGHSYAGPWWGRFSSPNRVKLPVGFNIGGSIAAEGSLFQ